MTKVWISRIWLAILVTSWRLLPKSEKTLHGKVSLDCHADHHHILVTCPERQNPIRTVAPTENHFLMVSANLKAQKTNETWSQRSHVSIDQTGRPMETLSHGKMKSDDPGKDQSRRAMETPSKKTHGNTKQGDPWKHQAMERWNQTTQEKTNPEEPWKDQTKRPMETPSHGKMKWEGSWKDQVRGAIESGSCSLWWQYDLVG